jgi:alpha-beta hydrolase superfamily lysophospholipase
MGAHWLPSIAFVIETLFNALGQYPVSVALPPGSPPPSYHAQRVTARDGILLHFHEWSPPGDSPAKVIVVFLPGIGMHGAPYRAVAAGFTTRGVTLIVPDLRGHGRSGGERGTLADAATLRSDLDCILDMLNDRHRGVPIVLAGESMGGLLAANYARSRQHRLAGLALLAPYFQLHPSRLQGLGGAAGALLANRVPIDTDEQLLPSTRMPDFAAAKKRDPFAVHEVRPSYLLQIASISVNWPKIAAEIRLPLHVRTAGDDKIVDNNIVFLFYQLAGTPPAKKSYASYPKARHTLCWDPDSPEIIEDLVQFALERRK